MLPPILLISDDVDIFETTDAAERYLETDDIAATVILDRNGTPITAVSTKVASGATVVRFRIDPRASLNERALHAGLVRLISGRERIEPRDLEGLSTERLVERALQYATR